MKKIFTLFFIGILFSAAAFAQDWHDQPAPVRREAVPQFILPIITFASC